MVTIADTMVGRARFEPGWRWSNDVKPIAGTDRCMVLHEGSCVSGSAIVQADDGTETRVGPGDGYVLQPGHDAWVVGERLKAAGATVIQAPDQPDEDPEGWIATFADPDDNYFQLVSPIPS